MAKDKIDYKEENIQIGRFLLWAAEFCNEPGAQVIGEQHKPAIAAAANRLRRQQEATRKAGSATSRKKTRAVKRNARLGGRPKGKGEKQ